LDHEREAVDIVAHNDELQLFANNAIMQISRMRKSLCFRAKRREQKLKHFGSAFNVRSEAKNINRQVAAIKRKRDDAGKFLDGPKKRPCLIDE
jgi:hypothetical protein